jgi:DNA-binding NarL/FixJ family response regulator
MEKITILLAEDHVVVRQGIRRFLEREDDFSVLGEASDGEEAVRLTRQLKPDVVVMDIAMPRLNGIEATKQIKQLQQRTIVLILTAYDYEEYIFPILEAGAAGYLLKDVSGDELIDAIHIVHEGGSVLHPTVTHKLLERFRGTSTKHAHGQAPDLLTEREVEVLEMAARGLSNKEIASELSLSVRTVESHFGSIFNKLGVGSRIEAVIQAVQKDWITLGEPLKRDDFDEDA